MVGYMIIRRTYDRNEINSVLSDPDIKKRITSDNTPDSEIPITDEYCYLLGEAEGEIIGLTILHPFRDGLEAHYQVLPQYRKRYAMQFAQETLNIIPPSNIYGVVPTYHQNIIEFDKKLGLEHVDTLKGGYIKDGKEYDYFIMRLKHGLS
jgi:hypothetical protein